MVCVTGLGTCTVAVTVTVETALTVFVETVVYTDTDFV